ncbi:hypothetical protein [Embleya sp. NPDC005971]|uniref:hypothetical protein n=1 Tax=Embleya sp. NPDC005971 TaxID=3156724 RepID=UPI003406ACE8
MRSFLRFLLLASLVVGCGLSENLDGGVSRAETDRTLRGYSSRVFDGLALHGRHGDADDIHPTSCEFQSATESSNLQVVTHFWQIDDLPVVEIGAAVDRLRKYLLLQKWQILDFAAPPEVDNTLIRAKNPEDDYVIWVKAIGEMNRVIVRVSSPCVRLS